MPPSPTIPPGSWILVTGVNGFICGHTAKQLLDRGYKVRGTVRGASKSAWLTNDLFAVEAASSSFEIVEVRDLAAPDAFSTAMRNVSGVVHVATITSMDPNPAHVVPQAVSGCILNAAASGPSVKQVVYTSTAGVAAMLVPNTTYHVIQTSWNDLAAREANAPPRYLLIDQWQYTWPAKSRPRGYSGSSWKRKSLILLSMPSFPLPRSETDYTTSRTSVLMG